MEENWLTILRSFSSRMFVLNRLRMADKGFTLPALVKVLARLNEGRRLARFCRSLIA